MEKNKGEFILKVSIIIVNYNGRYYLFSCLNSLNKLDYPNIEIIIVDNGSNDGSVEMLRKFKVQNSKFEIRLIENKENLGFVGGNNIGVEKAKGKYVLLLNNDTKITPDFLSLLFKKIENEPDVGVVQPKIVFFDNETLQAGGSFLTSTGFLYHFGFGKRADDQIYNKKMDIFSANGACMLIRREVIEKFGLFDQIFFNYFEESDFCWRVWLGGYRVIYAPEAVIYHKGSQTGFALGSYFMQYHSFKNRICSLIKNLGFVNLLIILPLHLLICAVISFIFLFSIQISRFIAIQKAIIWNILNLRETLHKRKEVQNLRVKKDDELFATIIKNPSIKYFIFFLKSFLMYKG